MSSSETDLDKILHKVNALITKAEHESTPPQEAALAQQMADAMMLKYAITQATLNSAKPVEEKAKPIIRLVEVGAHDNDIIGYMGSVVNMLAVHCRCQVRLWAHYKDGSWFCKVYGYEHDVRYFDMLYTTIRLHMLGVLVPRIDRSATLEDNAYRLHNAGYNWLEIAGLYGWQKAGYPLTPPAGMKMPFYSEKLKEWRSGYQLGGMYKRAYYKACEVRGEKPVKISAGGTRTYRKSAAQGYSNRLRQRIWDIENSREAGTAIVLSDQANEISKLFREDNPELFVKADPSDEKKPVRRRKYVEPSFNREAYARGSHHADTADLNASSRVGGNATKAVN